MLSIPQGIVSFLITWSKINLSSKHSEFSRKVIFFLFNHFSQDKSQLLERERKKKKVCFVKTVVKVNSVYISPLHLISDL